jgi:hypothetical protein
MVKKLKKIPEKYIEIDPGFKTKYLQHKKTGKLFGRQGRKKGHLPKLIVARTDTSPAASKVRRIKAKKGKYADNRGEIYGRASIVKKHKRISKKGVKHKVKKHKRKR